jgi:hypothetical protein
LNLVRLYLGAGIEEIPLAQLESILRNNNSVKVRIASQGMIMLSTKKVIKCVKEYYRTPEGHVASKKNISNRCYYVQKELGITNVSNYDCVHCHLKCIEMDGNKTLLCR